MQNYPCGSKQPSPLASASIPSQGRFRGPQPSMSFVPYWMNDPVPQLHALPYINAQPLQSKTHYLSHMLACLPVC
eukprot:1157498-Pelagomonas_calceolata.AAC.2